MCLSLLERKRVLSRGERASSASLSQLGAASLSQLEAVLLDVSSLGQLEAASLSLEEALAFCLLNREEGPSLFLSLSLWWKIERES